MVPRLEAVFDTVVRWPGWTAVLALAALATLIVFFRQLLEMTKQREEMARQNEELRRQGDEARHQPVTPQLWLSVEDFTKPSPGMTGGLWLRLHASGNGVAYGVRVDIDGAESLPPKITMRLGDYFASLAPGDSKVVQLGWPQIQGEYTIPLRVQFDNILHRKTTIRQLVKVSGGLDSARLELPIISIA